MADVQTAATTDLGARSRAVVRHIEPGSLMSCAACGAQVKFSARAKAKQVICNVYEGERWARVEHYHVDCYEVAGAPHGPADHRQPFRQLRRSAGSSAA